MDKLELERQFYEKKIEFFKQKMELDLKNDAYEKWVEIYKDKIKKLTYQLKKMKGSA